MAEVLNTAAVGLTGSSLIRGFLWHGHPVRPIAHIVAVACTLAIYLLLGFAYLGWGRALLTLTRVSKQTPDTPVMSIWLGWAFTLLIFQTLHLFLPMTAYVVVPVLVFGIVLAVPATVSALQKFPKQRANVGAMILTVILGFGVAVWVASKAMLPPTVYDSGLYHFNAIRWINTYHIVPGLGNLHGRLAFNQSFFTYVAALNFYPFFGHGRSLANSFLLLLLVATLFPSLRSVLRQPALMTERHIFRHAPDLLALPIVAYLALSSNGLASPTPDLASILLQLAMFVMLAHGIAEWLEGQKEQDQRAMVLVVLAATAVTIKLSNLVFSAVIIYISFVYAWQRSRARIQGAVRIALPVAAIALVAWFRGFMLSGAPLYPSTIGYMPVGWAVPKERVVIEARWVYSWARQPGAQPDSVLGNWNWLGPWSHRIMVSDKWDVVYPVALAALFCAIAMVVGVLSFLRKRSGPRLLEGSVLLPMMLGLAYWFVTAPDPRFAHALFWLLPLSSALLLLSSVRATLSRRALLVAICVVFVLANLHLARLAVSRRGAIKDISVSGWCPVKEVPLIKKVTRSGLVVYTPEGTPGKDQCWDSPIPSTPYFNPDLRLRTPGNMAAGFIVEK